MTDDVFDLPGIGPIRARALRKAGYETLSSLKDVSEDNLSSIRGITPLKASQIVQFIKGWQQPVNSPIVEDEPEFEFPDSPLDDFGAIDLESELLELEGVCRVSLELLETWGVRKQLRRELKNWIDLLDKKLKRGKVSRKYHPPAADYVEFLTVRLEIQNLVLDESAKGARRITNWLEFQRKALEVLL